MAVGFSASSREYQLDDINASKKLVLNIDLQECYHDSDAIIIAFGLSI